ncbi:MAG TPA: glycosyltransferase family 4 protein [Acidimicrobiales bacterium]|nr:glycosyltransferase family 4 protein [Acidimicrobiales bacterium]
MTASAVHQFIPSFVGRDAIGGHALQVRSVLREMGLASDLFVADASPEHASISRPYDSYRARPGDWILYQASTGHRMADWLLEQPQPLLVNYHNVTPPALLETWEPGLADEVAEGRRQIGKLAVVARHAIAVSHYNEAELDELGYRSTSVVPLLIDLDAQATAPDRVTLDWLARGKEKGGADLLFVGRIVPNKAQHDVLKALAAYRRTYDPRARLHLVGGASSPNYLRALRRFVGALDLWDAVDLAGSVSDAERAAYYAGADALVCLSDHEGFCVPILEAMHAGVPVVAFASTAIPETVAGAGVVLPAKTPALVAAAVHRVVADGDLRKQLVEAGRARAAEFAPERTRPRFAAAVQAALGAAG